MLRLKFLESTRYFPITEFKVISEHVVEVKGNLEFFPYGFEIYTEDKQLIGKYDKYKTLYKHVDGGFQCSDNKTIWIPTIQFVANGGELDGELIQHTTDWKYVKTPFAISTDTMKFKGWDKLIPAEGVITDDDTFTAEWEYIPPEPTPIDELEKRLDALEVDVESITPYTETKTAYIGDTEVVFDNVAGNNLTVFAITESGKAVTTTSVMADGYIKVTFDALEEVASITISLI